MTALESFLKNDIHTTFREYDLLPEKQIRSQCSFNHTFEEKTFLTLQMQRHGPIIWVKPN